MAHREAKYLGVVRTASMPGDIKKKLLEEVESTTFSLNALNEFRLLDTNNDHILDRTEIKKAFGDMLSEAGHEVKLNKLDAGRLMAEFDEDRSGGISFTEYLEMAQYVYASMAVDEGGRVLDLLSTKRRAVSAADRTERLLAAATLTEDQRDEIRRHIYSPEFRKEFATKFDNFDFDHDNKMDTSELAVALSRVGRKASVDITKHSVDLVMSEFDADGNGFLGKGEFIEMARMLYVSKLCPDVRETGIGRFSAAAATERNSDLAHKAVDMLTVVMNKNEEARRAERTRHLWQVTAVLATAAAAAAFFFGRRRH